MKRIIIAATIALVAIVTQAATFDWSASRMYGADGNLSSATGYLVLTSAMTRDAALTAVSNGDLASVTGAAVNSASFSAGSMTASAANTFDYNVAAGNSIDAFFVVVDGDKAFLSATASAVAVETGSSTFVFGNQRTASQSSSNWVPTGSVPEPTTGLLVLLGMAGLALKRKVA